MESTNKIPLERVAIIEEHIRNFSKYISYYSRAHNPTKKYLILDLSSKTMYDLCKKFYLGEKNVQPEKESYYRTVFNLSFHRPQTDTCVICDRI